MEYSVSGFDKDDLLTLQLETQSLPIALTVAGEFMRLYESGRIVVNTDQHEEHE